MIDEAKKMDLEKVKKLKTFAISGIEALPESGSSELLSRIIDLITQGITQQERVKVDPSKVIKTKPVFIPIT